MGRHMTFKHIHGTEDHLQARLKTRGSKIDFGRDGFVSPDPGNTRSVPLSYCHRLSPPGRAAAEAITHNLFMTEKNRTQLLPQLRSYVLSSAFNVFCVFSIVNGLSAAIAVLWYRPAVTNVLYKTLLMVSTLWI